MREGLPQPAPRSVSEKNVAAIKERREFKIGICPVAYAYFVGLSRGMKEGLLFHGVSNHLVDETVLLGLYCAHKVIALCILFDGLEWFSGVL